MRIKKLTLITLFITLWLSVPSLVLAQTAGPEILNNSVELDFPETATFRLELDSEYPITDALLTYQVGQRSCLSAGTQVPVETDGSVLEWTWVMSRSGNPPPGAQMWWQWTVTFEGGETITTPRKEVTFTDDRFDWQTIEGKADGLSAPIKLHWYEGDEVGAILHQAAIAGLQRLQEEMGITIQDEVEIFIYADSADMRDALLYIQEWAGGAALSEYNTVLIGVPPDQATTWGTDTVRHELAHLVIDQFGQSCVGGGRPNWLNEGLAMYAEGEPGESILTDIEDGIQDNSFQPVRSLNGPFPAQSDGASAAYSQSFSLVDFLLTEYGQEKMQQLLLTLAAAESYDKSLEKIYGMNSDGLENAWRAYIGAALREIPPTPTAIAAANVPTVVPLGELQNWPTPDEAQSTRSVLTATDDDQSSGICGLAIAPFFLLAGIVGFYRRNSGRQGE